ncbi:MAG TPA: elongation factor G [Candidatus Thiothrix moscowensis]|uniref:elongation factor G n=1 Tax=unclassified Thiothrix TaxID=2636184 RepID=UPI0025EBA028|nr:MULTISPECIES: elongation factor G [unclassified Thiothrix]HRJ54191.1 elongation factor G [Candidatus Thiothrix moscowensis]HRJ94457.1 elongation factor G [Candidatus Thiothrix moscowensis]
MHTTQDIRNVVFIGHTGAGKTSLIEALLFQAGETTQQGDVDKGNTVTDCDPLEQQHHHSLYVSVATAHYAGCHINLIDTPGYPDFQGQVLTALTAADTVVVVINAQAGIEPMSRKIMEWASNQRLPCMVVINRIDTAPDKLAQRLEEITEVFGRECLPLDLPVNHAKQVVEVYDHESGDADFSSVGKAHTTLIEQVVEADEAAMEHYLEEGSVSAEELHAAFERALREHHLVPVCFTSAETGTGVPELLDIIAKLAPNPQEATPHPFIRHQGDKTVETWAAPDSDKPLLAHVFHVEFDPFVGKLALLRVHQGNLKLGNQVLAGVDGKAIKIAHLYRLQGKERIAVQQAVAGDICAIAKINEIELGTILHERHEDDGVAMSGMTLPTPLVGFALRAKKRGDEQKLSEVLHKLVAEDPCLRIEYDATANETVLRGLGDLHLRIALERMDKQYHVEVDATLPRIPYRETITKSAQAQYRHKKQTGGAGQFGEVLIEVEPLARGTGFEFVSRIVGGAVSGSLIPAVEKGVRQLLASGAISGNPLMDIRVTLLDGKMHSVDSKEIAFVTAGRKAFMQAIAEANPIILEPVVDLEVTVPAVAMGDISGDLATRRAQIHDTQADLSGNMVIQAKVPLVELTDYASRLNSLTGGEGSWAIQFSHYEPVTEKTQQELMAQYKATDE